MRPRGSKDSRSSARKAGSRRTRSSATQSFGPVQILLPELSCRVVLSAAEKQFRAPITTRISNMMKTDLLLRQTRMHFPRFDADEVDIAPIEKGGSDRKFYRVRSSAEQSV